MAPETPGKAKARSFAEEMVEFMMKEAGGDTSSTTLLPPGSSPVSHATSPPVGAATGMFDGNACVSASLCWVPSGEHAHVAAVVVA